MSDKRTATFRWARTTKETGGGGRRREMSVKLMNGVLGLVAGVASIPVKIVVWPIMLAWWIANETEGEM